MSFVTLSELVEPVQTCQPAAAFSGCFPYIDIAAIDRDAKSIANSQSLSVEDPPSRARQLVRRGDVLVSTVRPNLNAVALVDSHAKAIASTGFTVLRPRTQVLDSSYLFRWVQTPAFINEMVRQATGASYPAVSDAIVKGSKIPLPPLAEQKRIAAILDKADAIRRKREQAIKLADEFLRSLFLDMFGDPVRNPKGWPIVAVGEITTCIVPGRDKPKSFSGTIPWITTDDLDLLGFTKRSKKGLGLTLAEIEQVRAKVIPQDSVIMTCVGDLGISSISAIEMVVNQQLHAFRCSGAIEAPYLLYLVPQQVSYLRRTATSTTVPYLNKEACNSLPVPLPPVELQRQFSASFTKISVLKDRLKMLSNSALTLTIALTRRAFRGEL